VARTLPHAPGTPTEPRYQPALTEAAAEAWIPHTCFKTGPPERVGIELEFLLHDPADPTRGTAHLTSTIVDDARRAGIASPLTVEPGGQIEISAPPADGLAEALAAAAGDLAVLEAAAARHGVVLDGTALDPLRSPRRMLDHPRYAAMESHLDRWGFPGRTMMCSTTSVQVNLEAAVRAADTGTTARPPDTGRRWHLLHALRPTLVAAFANSPLRLGRPTGWKSTRQAVWLALDPARTGQPPPTSGDPPRDWTRWALDCPLLLVRRDDGPWTAPPGVTFRDWLRHPTGVVPGRGAPTAEDLDYHLTTLFPPVRPRGHLEVRYLDAQPGPFWQVPAAVLVALTEDDAAADQALDAVEPVAGHVITAARTGVADPALRRAAVGVLTAAAGALRSRAPWRDAAAVTESYLERWTSRGRSPADDLLESASSRGAA
jgi:glutamate--cysteine ligase